MDISAKMPATMDSTRQAKMPSTMKSEAAHTGDNGSDDAPDIATSQVTPKTVGWECVNDNQAGWEAVDAKTSKGWEATDRKDEGDEGAMPQRDPDNDGDLN